MFKEFMYWLISLQAILLAGCSGGKNVAAPPEPGLEHAYPEVAAFLQERLMDVKARPGSDDAWGRYAMSLDAHEYHTEAIICYENAVALAPQRLRWKYLLSVRFQEQFPEKAADLLKQVCQSDHPSLAALIRYSDLLAELQRNVDRQNVLLLAEKEFPDHPAVLSRRARFCFESGDEQEALKILETLQGNYRETIALKQRILARVSSTVSQPALTSVNLPGTDFEIEDSDLAAVANYRHDPLWCGRIAAEKASAGDQSALHRLTALVKSYPNLVDNRLQLAIVLQKRLDFDQAKMILQDGLKLDPMNPRFLGELAAIAIDHSKWAEAEQWLKTLLQHHPESIEARIDLSYVMEQTHRLDEAFDLLKQALKHRPDDSEMNRRLKVLEETIQDRRKK